MAQAGPRRRTDTRTQGKIKGNFDLTNTDTEHEFRAKGAPMEDGRETKNNPVTSRTKCRHAPCRSQERAKTKLTAGRGDLGENRDSKCTHES